MFKLNCRSRYLGRHSDRKEFQFTPLYLKNLVNLVESTRSLSLALGWLAKRGLNYARVRRLLTISECSDESQDSFSSRSVKESVGSNRAEESKKSDDPISNDGQMIP
jgi:hypothetical protein